MTQARALSTYPRSFRERNRWIVAQRGPKNRVSADRPYAALKEAERSADGRLREVVTVFLTNRECPWKCFMCDLWQNTLDQTISAGAVLRQIETALNELEVPEDAGARAELEVKLYNSGSFFDPGAIPPEADAEVARSLSGFRNVIVESHPRLVGDRCLRFRDRLDGSLEVAMGLETAHPEALEHLNKGFTPDTLLNKCRWLRSEGIGVRVFLLVNPPFVPAAVQEDWLVRSLLSVKEAGGDVVCLIPTRSDSGALAHWRGRGDFEPTRLEQLERGFERGLGLGLGRVFADLWDLESFSACDACLSDRSNRLQRMNHEQVVLPAVACAECGHG